VFHCLPQVASTNQICSPKSNNAQDIMYIDKILLCITVTLKSHVDLYWIKSLPPLEDVPSEQDFVWWFYIIDAMIGQMQPYSNLYGGPFLGQNGWYMRMSFGWNRNPLKGFRFALRSLPPTIYRPNLCSPTPVIVIQDLVCYTLLYNLSIEMSCALRKIDHYLQLQYDWKDFYSFTKCAFRYTY
jgi:hypothetical protein